MQNKGLVIFLTVVITALCFYYLSFTFVGRKVQQDALSYSKGDLNKKQAYLDSIWNMPVYNLLGSEYTYKEVKDKELSLGLDLQGGMHVTLEVSPVDIIKGLSGNSQDSSFLSALKKANIEQKATHKSFADLFYRIYRQDNPGKKLSTIFANSITKGRIAITDDDGKVEDVINKEIENAIERSFTIIRNRLDQFGTSQPNVQRLPGSGQIQVEIPGADNPQRVRKLLQGVARLEFWDVVDPNTLNTSLMAINDILVKEQKAAPTAAAATDASKKDENLSALLGGDSTKVQSDSAKAADVSKGLDSLQNLNVSPIFALSTPPGAFRYAVKDTAKINSIFRRADIKLQMPRTVGVFWANKPEKDLTGEEALELYFLDIGRNGIARLTGEVITDARNDLDEFARQAVSMNMNAAGTRTWANGRPKPPARARKEESPSCSTTWCTPLPA